MWNATGLAIALVAVLGGCATSLTPLTAEQTTGLQEAQRIADRTTKVYGVPGVRVYAASLGPSTGGSYFGQNDWIFIRPESLTGKRLLVLISHELATPPSAIARRSRPAPSASATPTGAASRS